MQIRKQAAFATLSIFLALTPNLHAQSQPTEEAAVRAVIAGEIAAWEKFDPKP